MFFCSACDRSYDACHPRWRCDCGNYLLYRNGARFPLDQLGGRPGSIWRYREMLGLENGTRVSLGEGFTPLERAQLMGRDVWLKLDFMCPTGSYKDRGSSAMLSKLKEWGVPEIVEDSSGNAGASVAAYAALAGIRARIFVPQSTSAGKSAQIAMYGAELVKVPGSREETTRAARAAADAGGFYASHNWSAHFLLGMKTVAYEIAEQLQWDVPDFVVAPIGGGSLLCGAWLGFQDLAAAGAISRLPRMVAVQAANCPPVYDAWKSGLDTIPAADKKDTAAEGIAVARPIRDKLVLQSLRESNGIVATVGESCIWEMTEALGHMGVYVEPTSATAAAAAADLIATGVIAPHQSVAILLTGSGLKATDKIVAHYF
ncbi:MAG: threonine synthase [Candidatus Solibacter sp.]|nr:threonine synthase [Candidatus Solibacter sp.]